MNFLRKYKIEIAIVIALLLSVFGAWMGDFYRAAQTVQNEVLRLHILAASDSEEDQRLKLCVRDRLLTESERWFEEAGDKLSAEELLQGKLREIAAIAQDELVLRGCHEPVTVQLCREPFSTRAYEGFTLPAGEYDALRILIGEGEGQNWWCVIFPSLCLSSSMDRQTESWFAEHDLQVLEQEPCFEPRFALLEWAQRLKNEKAS